LPRAISAGRTETVHGVEDTVSMAWVSARCGTWEIEKYAHLLSASL